MPQDLTVPLKEGKLNIRVAIWIEQEENILVSEFPNDLITLPGGRIKFDEASNDAAIRELYEETGERLMNVKLFAIIENFFLLGQ
ncbi:MAG TPA: NUDIX domain-containing protein, partial [Solibacillus sp.]